MFRSIIVLTSIVVLFSCIKDPVTDPTPNVKLLKIAHQIGRPDHIEFTYDNLDRVVYILKYRGEPGQPVPPGDSLYKIIFHYTGNAMMPSVMHFHDHFTGVYKRRHHLFYSVDGKLQRDSVRNLQNNTSYNRYYSYQGSKTMITEDHNGWQMFDTVETQNGNAMWQSHRYTTSYEKNTYEYDNKINPLHKMNIAPVVLSLAGATGALYLEWSPVSQNNVTRRTSTAPMPGSFTVNNIYDQNGWLVKFYRTYEDVTHIQDTIIFKY